MIIEEFTNPGHEAPVSAWGLYDLFFPFFLSNLSLNVHEFTEHRNIHQLSTKVSFIILIDNHLLFDMLTVYLSQKT